ncbi:MAG: DUF58 domain-containing protein [Gammaproteobacteria bacterium]
MANAVTKNQSPTPAGIYTDLPGLLGSRHWARNLKLFSRQAARSMLLGETRSRFRGRGMEFEEVRHYQPGDDIRNIDWRVSARTGSTYTKLFCEERERPVHILVDQRSSMFFGTRGRFKSVMAAELATALAWAALAGSDRIGGQIIGDHSESDIRARRNKQAVLKFIHDLNEYNRSLPSDETPQKGKTFTDMVDECRRITRPGTAIFILSDLHDFDDKAAKSLSKLGRHTDNNLFQILDPLEAELPVSGTVSISDGVHLSSVQLGSSLQKAYVEQMNERAKLLREAALRSRSAFIQVSTRDEPRQILNRIYGK